VNAAGRRFCSSSSEHGRATHGAAWRGGSGILRKKKEGTKWAMGWSGRVGRMPLGRRGEKTMKKVGWAARMTGLKWKIDFGFDFSNFISRI
jgi:hypothetical protein